MNHALRTGIALALTVAVAYALCALVFQLWPQAALNFMNALFHGLDFGVLQRGAALFDFGSFLGALLGVAAWAFAVGTLFGWIARKLGIESTA